MAMSDYDAEEQELNAQLGASERNHPSLALLRACEQLVLPPEMQLSVQQHLDGCALCTSLLADLATLPEPELSPAQFERMAAKLPGTAAPRTTMLPRLIGLAAAVLLCATGVFEFQREHARPASVAQARPVPASQAALEIPLTPLAPPTADSSTLLTRGVHAGPTVSELLPAFRAYNAGDYATSAKLLTPLSETYPRSRIVLLYLGVSQLYLHQTSEAMASLNHVRGLSAKLDPDATWYLAIASEHTDPAQSYKLLQALCDGPTSVYRSESCSLRDHSR